MAVRLLAPRGSDGSDFVPIDKAPMAGSFLFRQEPDQLRFCKQSMVKG